MQRTVNTGEPMNLKPSCLAMTWDMTALTREPNPVELWDAGLSFEKMDVYPFDQNAFQEWLQQPQKPERQNEEKGLLDAFKCWLHCSTKSKNELIEWCMKEGLIASNYECPKCNDQHDVTWSAIKRFLRNCASHAECMFDHYLAE
ncbi:flattop-like protein [Trichonephila clavipes]|nr:flattop-like protein [Trichonephila clavipes]